MDRNGNPKHPQRWTGDWDILKDIRTIDADKVNGALVRNTLGTSMTDFHNDNYQMLNKSIHGSGVLGVRGTPEALSWRCGKCYWSSASLAMICVQVILIDFGFAEHLPDIQTEWERIGLSRKLSFIKHIKQLNVADLS